ncbi:JAB domain-containing protein [Roseburia hominis]
MAERVIPEFHQVEPRLSLVHFPPVQTKIERAVDAIKFVCRNILNESYRERLIGIYCDCQLHPVCYSVIAEGDEIHVDTRIQDILTPALLYGVSRIILIHNHPSGSGAPSENDYKFSYNMYHRCMDFGMYLMDSIIMPCGQNPDDIKFTSLAFEKEEENPWYQYELQVQAKNKQKAAAAESTT